MRKILVFTLIMLIIISSVSALQGPSWVHRYLEQKEQVKPETELLLVHINQSCNQTINATQKESARIFISEDDIKEFELQEQKHIIKMWSISKNRILYSLDGKLYRTGLPYSQQVRITYFDMTAKIQRSGTQNIFMEFFAFDPQKCD